MVETLTHVLLNPHFKPRQSVIRDTCKEYGCQKCKCREYSSNIVAIFTYLPIEQTRIAASIMSSESIPFLAFSNEKFFLHTSSYTRNPYMYSSYELAAFNLVYTIDTFNIKNLALVNIGKFATDLALYHQAALWNQLVVDRHICIQRKNIGALNVTEMKNYVDYIRGEKSIQLIVLWSYLADIPSFIELTNNITDRIWYWYTEYSIFQNGINFNLDIQSMATHVFFRHPVYSFEPIMRPFAYKDMSLHITKALFFHTLNDKWIASYLKQVDLDTSDPEVFKHFDNKTTLDQHYIESLVLLVWYFQSNISNIRL